MIQSVKAEKETTNSVIFFVCFWDILLPMTADTLDGEKIKGGSHGKAIWHHQASSGRPPGGPSHF